MSQTSPQYPGVIVSVPCKSCGDTTSDSCAECKGEGIVLLHVCSATAVASEEEIRRHGQIV